jgi:hypothetical protein
MATYSGRQELLILDDKLRILSDLLLVLGDDGGRSHPGGYATLAGLRAAYPCLAGRRAVHSPS